MPCWQRGYRLAGSLRWRPEKGRGVGVASKYVRAWRRMHCIRKWSLSCLSQLQDRDALRRPAARRFVRDAQSAVRLPESRSRLRIDRLTGSRTALWAYWTNRLGAGRRTASRSRNCDKHDSDLLTHAVHSPPCPNVYIVYSGIGTVLFICSCWVSLSMYCDYCTEIHIASFDQFSQNAFNNAEIE